MEKYYGEIRAAVRKRNAYIQFLCCDPQSQFLKDIEHMEIKNNIREKDGPTISDEINQIVNMCEEINDGNHFAIRYYQDEYRLPFIIAYYPNKKSKFPENYRVEAWLTVSLPPYKSKDGDTSFILKCEKEFNLGDDFTGNMNFIDMMETSFNTIWELYGPNKKSKQQEQKQKSKKQKAGKQKQKARKQNS